MNQTERIKAVKAMEFLARQINDEEIFDRWLMVGVADGDIEYGDLSAAQEDLAPMEYYIRDDNFAELLELFLRLMAKARRSGGLFCDGIVSKKS